MINKSFRLRRWRVQKILKRGESKNWGLFTVRLMPNKTTFNRWGIVLSRKFEKSAVKRNKKKRQIYEAIRNNVKTMENNIDLATKTHYDLVLIPHKSLLNSSYETIYQHIHDIITNLSSL